MRYRFWLICINYNFDFLVLYKMYFQNYFARRSIILESFTSHLQHERPCCIRYTNLIQHGRSCCKYYLTCRISLPPPPPPRLLFVSGQSPCFTNRTLLSPVHVLLIESLSPCFTNRVQSMFY